MPELHVGHMLGGAICLMVGVALGVLLREIHYQRKWDRGERPRKIKL